MILLDAPYVSGFLLRTIVEHRLPVVATAAARSRVGAGLAGKVVWLDEAAAAARVRSPQHPAIYTNSENALAWLDAHAPGTRPAELAALFKDKAAFRELVRPLHPRFRFRTAPLTELAGLDTATLPWPCVVKPAAGFFSLGVRHVASPAAWAGAVADLGRQAAGIATLYPAAVLDPSRIIIEECLEGEEYAVDAYYDDGGRPVVLGIFHHRFGAADDVGDRVYATSRAVMEAMLEPVTAYLARVGELAGARNFPVHVELRRAADGALAPIEFNPLRFGGWCTTADLGWHAWGFNPYVTYLAGGRPDWPRLLAARDATQHALIVLDNSTGLPGGDIEAFAYERLLERFSRPLELRRIDHRRHPLFGFLLAAVPPGCEDELDAILHSDLCEFVTARPGAGA